MKPIPAECRPSLERARRWRTRIHNRRAPLLARRSNDRAAWRTIWRMGDCWETCRAETRRTVDRLRAGGAA